jgi:hypothetical protein
MASAHQEALLRGSSPWHVRPDEKPALYYQTRCIQALQHSLVSCKAGHNVSEGTIRAVMRVSYAESISGNYKAQVIH